MQEEDIGWFVIKNSKFFHNTKLLMNRMAMPMYIVSIVCVVMVVATPLGIERNGAKRWLGYGIFSFAAGRVGKIPRL